jgi:PAS domain-containing protein
MPHSELSNAGLIYATGEMAERIRGFDWSGTPVGDIEQWPELLLTTVNTLLGSRQPMFLWWGDELIQFYNDGYQPSLGADKHPLALGLRGQECWPEIWHVIGPLIEDVMQRGKPYWSEDQLIPIYRNGKLEDVYWTFSYSPVWDARGKIHGTLVVCSETTRKVLADKEVLAERARLLAILQQAPAFFALLQGPDHVISLVNPRYLHLVNNRDVVGKTVRVALPEVAEQGYIEILAFTRVRLMSVWMRVTMCLPETVSHRTSDISTLPTSHCAKATARFRESSYLGWMLPIERKRTMR